MTDEELRAFARRRLKAKNDFRNVLAAWIAISLLVVAVWFTTSPGGYFWPVWPILGLGIATLLSGLNAFGLGQQYISDADVDAEVKRITGK